MREKIPMNGKEYVVVEGIFRHSFDNIVVNSNRKNNRIESKNKAILYTGNLNRRYGILLLLDAFSKLDNSYELWIRGDGELKEEIIHLSKKNSRIKYFEPMDKNHLWTLLTDSDVLVNPVSPHEEFTRYFFPSKTMEYIASGTPVVMFHLDCIPKEYNDFLIYSEEVTSSSFRRAIEFACGLSEKEKAYNAKKAKQFILDNKNSFVQAEKICRLIECE